MFWRKFCRGECKFSPVSKYLVLILVVSLALRIFLVLARGPAYDLNSDDRSYLTTAQILLERGVFTYNDPERPTVFIMPGYPLFIAFLMKLLGPGLILEQTIRLIQSLVVTASIYLLFLIAKEIFSERVGLYAAGIAAFYPPLYLVSSLILTEALFLLALMLLVYAALMAMKKPDGKRALFFALTWAFAVYIRPTIALWPGVFFCLLLAWKQIPFQRLLKLAMLVIGIFVLLLLPWWVRNYHVSGGRFIPLTKSSGNPLLLGTYMYGLPSLEEQRTWHKTNNLWINDEIDKKRAMERIKEGFRKTPWEFFWWYTVGKFEMFWFDVYYWLPVFRLPGYLVKLYHYFVVVLGFVGMWLARRKREAVMVISLLAYITVLHQIYLAHGRYSVPFVPFVIMFAAYLLTRMRADNSSILRENVG